MDKDKSLNTKKIVSVAVRAAAVLAAAALFFFAGRGMTGDHDAEHTVDVLGHELGEYTTEISFSGDEISDLSALRGGLKKLHSLKRADLGSFHMSDAELEALKAEFPDVEFVCVTNKTVAGKVYSADAEELDLTGAEIDFAALEGELAEFENLRRVTFGDDAVRASDMEKLRAAFPNVDFSALLIYSVSGREFREDAEEIDLSGAPLTGDIMSELSPFGALSSVNLRGTGVGNSALIELKKAYPSVSFLAEVELGGEVFDSEVKTIDLNSKKVGDFDVFFETTALFNSLERLELCDCGFSNEQMEKLRDAYPGTKVVWRVYLGKWSLRTDATAFSVLIMASDKYERMTAEDIEVLKYCTDLQALDIGHQAVGDISVIGEYLTGLRVLILADNKISDLTPLSKLPHLHYLEIFVNSVSDISPLADCRELVDLNISYNRRISDITPLLELPLIERLWLEHVSVPSKDVERLRSAHPNASIFSVGEGSIDHGWRTHPRYKAMIDMFHNNYISEEFSKYDG